MSLKEVQSIKVPIVWTLHDMWIFQPFLHYTSERYIKYIQNSFLAIICYKEKN